MKLKQLAIIFVSLLLTSAPALAVSTVNCPEKFIIELSDFETKNTVPSLSDSKKDSNLPFAHANVQNLKTRSESMTLKARDKGRCSYKSNNNNQAIIEGSLQANSKRPAVLKIYLSEQVQSDGLFLDVQYVGYADIKSLNTNKTLVLDPRAKLYFVSKLNGKTDHMPLGSVSLVVASDKTNCMSLSKAQKRFTEVLTKEAYYSTEVISDLAASLEWRESGWGVDEPAFYSKSFNHYQCAPGAECWDYFKITCAGDVEKQWGGED